ncbi:MAG: hypothetical protein IJ037_04525 [Clostridia bacterium]|nr:hypothetical protein [Clostridia bacterium]
MTDYPYTCTGNSMNTADRLKFTELWQTYPGQDGAMFGDWLIRFDARGHGHVFRISEEKEVAAFTLGSAEKIVPHANAVVFGTEYISPDDEFPLLYSNIYNNYAKSDDRLEGTVCVYRLKRNGSDFSADLVQVIRIGFVHDPAWSDGDDVRPYGNFVVDTDHNQLAAFTMRDRDQVTRYFTFDLPKSSDGVFCEEWGVPVVTLTQEDIRSRFDCPYSRYIQGACYHDGRVYSIEGFSDAKNPAKMQIVDLVRGELHAVIDLYAMGLTVEPEFVNVHDGVLYYSDARGQLIRFDFE